MTGSYKREPASTTDQVAAANGIAVSLSGDSESPIYLQLAEELRLLIKTGALAPGLRLPSVQHLGAHLGINRNTVHHAYSVLIAEGLLTGRRGGGTIVAAADTRSKAADNEEILLEIGKLLSLAQKQGLSLGDVVRVMEQYSEQAVGASRLRVGVVECNPDSLSYYVAELEGEFRVAVRPVLLENLQALISEGGLDRLDCIVSTYFHLSEVRRILQSAPSAPEIFAIAVKPHLSVLTELEALPRGSRVGVVYYDRGNDPFVAARLTRMVDMVRGSQFRHLTISPLLLRGKPKRSAFGGFAALLVRPENIRPVLSLIPRNVCKIEFVNQLDDATREFLRDVFNDMVLRGAKEAGGYTFAPNGSSAKPDKSDNALLP